MKNSRIGLPPQMISLKDKNEKWFQDCMDALETIGRQQLVDKDKLIENYEILKGKFIFKHYIDTEEYSSLLSQLTQEFDIPSHLKHYDIISQAVNTLSGEFQKRPDIFKVRDYSEQSKNNYTRKKKELLLKFVMQQINSDIQNSLLEQGLDPERTDFNSEEEYQQYQQIIQERTKVLTPREVQKYMDMDWSDVSELWGEHQKNFDDERFNRKETRRILFEDMLATDFAFKHFYITADDYAEEVWNPINTFYHKSPEITEIEKGDYVGRIFFLTIPEIINRYGHKLTDRQLRALERLRKDNYNKGIKDIGEGYPVNLKAGSLMPYADYPIAKFMHGTIGLNPHDPQSSDVDIDYALGLRHNFNSYGFDVFQVTEGYWMSQEKLGKYVYSDPETGEPLTVIVDETFRHDLIPGCKVLDNSFMELGNTQEPNTLTWTWVNKCYKGIKIDNKKSDLEDSIYFDLGPNDYQFKGDLNIYGAKLPVCGQIFNNRNGDSMSMVDLMKPDQIGHNIASNQLYELMEREVGRFMLMDQNLIPNTEDWGGEHNYEKLMMVAKRLGVAPVDGSQPDAQKTNFAHFQPIDMDETSRMVSRMNIADYFERKALSKIGFTPQRLGNISASESATGVQQATQASVAQTDSYFTRFGSFEKRCLQMSLDMAQYVQSKKKSLHILNSKSDMSRSYIEITGSDLTNAELGLFVSDSPELIRQLETIRQLSLNNTMGLTPPDLATVIFSNSPAEIKAQWTTSYRQQQELQQQQQEQQNQLQQQQIESQQQIAQMQIAKEDERLDKKLANDRYIAEVKAMATSNIGLGMDTDSSGVPDVLEVQKFNQQINKDSEDILFKKQQEQNKQLADSQKSMLEFEKVQLEHKKLKQEKELKDKEIEFKKEELKSKEKIAKYADKGTYGKTSKK